jgi:hypothetical protein
VRELGAILWVGYSSCEFPNYRFPPVTLKCSTKVLQLDIPNLCPCSIRSSPLPRTVHISPNPLFVTLNHPRTPHNIGTVPLYPHHPRNKRANTTSLPKVLLPKHLYPWNFRKRLYASIPWLYLGTPLWK